MSIYSNIKIEKKEGSLTTISGEISAETLKQKKELALSKINKRAEKDGFRKGKVPEKLLIKEFGEMAILEEAAELALSDAYPQILKEYNVDAIGYPKVSITKLAEGNPVEFKIETAIVPAVKLSDYKKIAGKIMSTKIDKDISDKDVSGAIEKIMESKGKKGEELSEEIIKEFGNFKDIEDFKTKLRENMSIEKGRIEREKLRASLMDELVKNSEIELPEILIEAELDRMIGQLEHDIIHAGMKFDEYLKQVKKTTDDIRKEWRVSAEKKARFQLILDEIAKTEKITAPEDQIKEEMNHYKKHYPDASEDRLRSYIETMLRNATVMEWLEKVNAE